MTNIVQLDYDELQAAIKRCMKEAVNEIRFLSTKPELPDRITLKEAIEITGLRRSAIYKKTMDGTIPHEKFGKRLIFNRHELEAWMKDRTIKKQSPEEIATEHLAKVARRKIK